MPETMGRKVLRRLTWHGDVRGRKDTDLASRDTGESEPYGPSRKAFPPDPRRGQPIRDRFDTPSAQSVA
jgi:hypothetical protein